MSLNVQNKAAHAPKSTTNAATEMILIFLVFILLMVAEAHRDNGYTQEGEKYRAEPGKVCQELIPKARLIAVPTATKCVNCKEETKKKEQENNRIEMAKLFAEEQRKEMMRKNAGR